MAKAPKETTVRVRVHAEKIVLLEEAGRLGFELTKLGFENVGNEYITDVKAFGRQEHETSGVEALTEYIKEHPTFQISDVVKHFKAQGRGHGHGAYGAAATLAEQGILKKLGPGNYASADMKHIEGPPGSAPAEKAHANTGKRRKEFEITGRESVWRHIKNRKGFKIKDLVTLFRAQGRNPISVSPIIATLAKEKEVKKIGDGEYIVVKNNPKPAKKAAPKKKAAPNLNETEPLTETNNG